MKKIKVLIACEYSGIIREAFTNKGCEAWSCDLLPTETSGNHIEDDVLKVINEGWDLMIAHPPCTYLSYVGTQHWSDIERTKNRIKAANFFMTLYDAKIKYICVENPRGIMSKIFRKPDQEIDPFYFGDPFLKRTDLWLKNLPPLKYSLLNTLFEERTSCERPKPEVIQIRKKTGKIKNRYWMDNITSPAFKNAKLRSKSFPAIAKAMADQWTEYLTNLIEHEK
ncbi:MAG: hypothetical protein ACRDE2_00295 [Chitinophagaceae bacterium]